MLRIRNQLNALCTLHNCRYASLHYRRMTEDFFLFIPKRDLILKKKNTFIRQFVIEFKKIVY